MRARFLSFSPPAIFEEEIEAVADTLRSEWITTGPKVEEFERAFSAFVGARGGLALNSCTAGLHLALLTLGVGPGDEVITTPMTFCASVNVIEHVGARPVLVDVEPDTLNIDPSRIEKAITPRTKCLMPVHFSGQPCDMDPLLWLARKHGLKVVEDAAHAVAASYRGRMVGTIGDLTAFSFYATKNLTTAEGGMLTGEPKLLEHARVLSLHGMSKDAWRRYGQGGSWFYEVIAPGFKYNMTDIQASIGLQQLRRLDGFQRRRREIAAAYSREFSKHPYFQTPTERPDVVSSWHLYVLRLNRKTLRIGRDTFIEELAALNIGASVHFIPIHLHPYYRTKYAYEPGDFPIAFANYHRTISLPLHPKLTDSDVQDVIDAVLRVAGSNRA